MPRIDTLDLFRWCNWSDSVAKVSCFSFFIRRACWTSLKRCAGPSVKRSETLLLTTLSIRWRYFGEGTRYVYRCVALKFTKNSRVKRNLTRRDFTRECNFDSFNARVSFPRTNSLPSYSTFNSSISTTLLSLLLPTRKTRLKKKKHPGSKTYSPAGDPQDVRQRFRTCCSKNFNFAANWELFIFRVELLKRESLNVWKFGKPIVSFPAIEVSLTRKLIAANAVYQQRRESIAVNVYIYCHRDTKRIEKKSYRLQADRPCTETITGNTFSSGRRDRCSLKLINGTTKGTRACFACSRNAGYLV